MKRQQRSRPRRNQNREAPFSFNARSWFRGGQEALATIITPALQERHKLVVAHNEARKYIENVWNMVESAPSPQRLKAARVVLAAVVEEAFDAFARTKKTGRRMENAVEFVDHREIRARHLSWIKKAAEGKAGRGRYGKTYELLIAVEDWWFDADDAQEVTAFIKREVLSLSLEFGVVHIVGLSEKLFLSFPLLRGEDRHSLTP